MHNHMVASGAMDPESHSSHDDSYDHGNWANMNSYTQTSMADYSGGFAYMPPITHGLPSLPSESISRMPPPPAPIQPPSHSQQNHPQLPMLMVPSHPTWPSMLTNPSSYSAPPVPIPPLPAGPPLKAPKSAHSQSQPRKTLTDDDRRKMCEYAEANPGVKQTEIGSMFGVERSTVSKVLRNREKYLSSKDRDSSPVKRNKSKFPDVEKALSNWLRNAQKSGVPVSDADIKEKFRFFATTTGGSETLLSKTHSSTWLEKFKQKNGIGHGRLVRRASETNIPDSAHMSRVSPVLSTSHSSSIISPASPSAHPSPSPLSANRSDGDRDGLDSLMDFTTSQAVPSFPASAISPTAPFSFSPDQSAGGFLSNEHAGSNFQRPRSQTFPTLDLEYLNQQQQQQESESMTPRYHHISATAPSSALDSPMTEGTAPRFGSQHAVSSPQLHRTNSSNSLAHRSSSTSVGGGVTSASAGSSPVSPTQEDARKAADTLLNFIQNAVPNGFVDQNDYLTIVRLTDKLRLQQHQQMAKGMGGLSRIPEGEVEMSSGPPHLLPKLETTMSA